jgi:hypothetical protein
MIERSGRDYRRRGKRPSGSVSDIVPSEEGLALGHVCLVIVGDSGAHANVLALAYALLCYIPEDFDFGVEALDILTQTAHIRPAVGRCASICLSRGT